MIDNIRQTLKEGLKNNNVDFEKIIFENNIKITILNYKDFCEDVIDIFNEVRQEAYIEELEDMYKYQAFIARKLIDCVKDEVLKRINSLVLPKEIENDIESYYYKFNSLSGVSLDKRR